ncbi:MAG: DNA mismatch repair protein MutS [Betaproteobacteria bacterium]|jgi:DNA-nicking Smr family endonuclease|nr:DNA mismatch repair protein MutS [Betaproteobacteria bacterium]
MVKARSLQDLALIKQTLSQQAEREAALAAEKLAQERRAKAEKNLFQRAVGQVKPLASQPRVELGSAPAPPKAFQQKRDDDRVLRESLSDDFDVSTLLDTDDELSYRRSGIGTDVTQKLRKGHWSLQGQIDLHGLRSDEAREALGQFIRDAHKRGWRCIRVVHGKGLGSPGKTPVLKAKVQRWLVQKNEVLAFVQAKASEGGAGALVVLLS